MNHRRFLELFWDFARHIEALHTLYLDSLVGYSILHERLQGHQESVRELLGDHEYATEEFQDTCLMSYKHISNCDYRPVSMSPVMKQGDMKQRLTDNGQNALLLAQQCVVTAYAYWEEYLRVEVGKAMGVLPSTARANEAPRKLLNKHVVSDFWGDRRHTKA